MLRKQIASAAAMVCAALVAASPGSAAPTPTGMLAVETDIPGATVEFAGREMSPDGASVELCVAAGTQQVRLSDGYAEIVRTVEVEGDGRTVLSLSRADLSSAELHGLGDGRFAQGLFAEAVPFFRDASRGAPLSEAYKNDLGLALQLSGAPEEARDVLADAVRINPGSAAAHYNLAGVLVAIGESEAAVWEYQQARRAKPEDPDIRNDLAATLYELGWFERAQAEYGALVAATPSHTNAWFGYAIVLEQRGETALARGAWERFVSLAGTPEDPSCLEIARQRLVALSAPTTDAS
jgi:Flp pilus assembly protein TadD